VNLRRLRSGERLALAGAIALAVLLGFRWFLLSTPDARIGAHESGIRSLGWLAALILLAAIVAALAMVFASVTQRAAAIPVIGAVLTAALGALAVLAIAVRLILQPGLGVDAGNADVDVNLPAILGLISALAIAAGGWRAVADERTETADSRQQTEDVLRVRGAPRPAPPRSNPAGPAQS
jgi:hypothetical protein